MLQEIYVFQSRHINIYYPKLMLSIVHTNIINN